MRFKPAMLLGEVLVAATLLLGGCQQADPSRRADTGQAVLPVNGVGYVLLAAPINVQTQHMLINNIDKLLAAGATRINLGLNSSGGDIVAAQAVIDHIAMLHASRGIDFDIYNTRRTDGAAAYLFLSGQRRYAAQNSLFTFVPVGLRSNGAVPLTRLRGEIGTLERYERAILAALKARTRLTDSAAQTYASRIVTLTADDALRDGIIDGIVPSVSLPPGAQAWIITSKTVLAGVRPAQ